MHFSLSAIGEAAGLGLATFGQEDVPTIAGATLAAAGKLPWTLAFSACSLGIWLGDALLYVGARFGGRRLLAGDWGRRLAAPQTVARSESWFARRGSWLLFGARFVPGLRLPTYLAAGVLRVPWPRFLAVTAAAVLIWTGTLFGAARVLGPVVVSASSRWGAWAAVAIVAILALGGWLGRLLWRPDSRRRVAIRFARWRRWEFWPDWLFQAPVFVYCLWLGIRRRGLMLPTISNPGIVHGGIIGESKSAGLAQIMAAGPEFTAEGWLLPRAPFDLRLASFLELARSRGLAYPCVLKPDIGERGRGVRVARSEADVPGILRLIEADLLVQRYAPGPVEVGVFYYRFPGEARGRIWAITDKQFPSVTGDGLSTLRELIARDPRARYMAERYVERAGPRADKAPPAGSRVQLVEAGNHAQGCVFVDGWHLWSPELEARIDQISRGVDGFYIGRYDLRCESYEDLRAGRRFQIVELNGAAAVATNIYDPANSLGSAYRTLFRQWALIFEIGAANRELGFRPSRPGEFWRSFRVAQRHFARLPISD